MGDARGKANVDLWLKDAPAEVSTKTEELLARVRDLRTEQTIYPAQDAILRALELTPPDAVRVVILGQDPYHEPGQAMGLSFSVPAGQRLPPSLRNVYKELAADLGCEPPATGDLTGWARQGVLLLNTTLTVREHAANSHARLGWQVLTNYLVRRTVELPQPICYLAWGRHAASLVTTAVDDARATGTLAGEKLVLTSTHPSPLSANRAGGGLVPFMGSRPFSQANAFLQAYGERPIAWA
ncbi:MAG: uracil-DNA glycosylase [Olsenella sp.]|jgi:uracil-DNA glycosylase|nr:uracil-DNA glycosylase [Olsenella sp.]MCI1288973.1 uracil-DNA glycosylase [Olsenella sp.]